MQQAGRLNSTKAVWSITILVFIVRALVMMFVMLVMLTMLVMVPLTRCISTTQIRRATAASSCLPNDVLNPRPQIILSLLYAKP